MHIIQAEISEPKSIRAAAAEVAKITGGSLDVLINNAALVSEEHSALSPGDITESNEAAFAKDVHDSITTNVLGVIYTVNAFLPLIKKGKSKKVITISTGMADEDLILGTEIAAAVPYSLSKGAVNVVVTKYAAQYKQDGIVFSAISPGWVDTATREREWPRWLKVAVEDANFGSATEADKAAYNWMLASFQKVAPIKGKLSTEDSVKMQLDTINKLTIKDTGKFISHHGDRDWFYGA